MSIELKIKSKHLAEEAKIIRKEEWSLEKQIKWLKKAEQAVEKQQNTRKSISDHRRWDVRNENRATYLARAFIKQVPYKTLESYVYDSTHLYSRILPRVLAMVKKYDNPNMDIKHIIAWVEQT